MKHLQIRALAILMTLWCGSIAQDKPSAPAAAAKAGAGAPAKVKAESRHKAFLQERKSMEADRKKVDDHLRKMRRGWDKQAEKERGALKEEKRRTPKGDGKARKASAPAKKN